MSLLLPSGAPEAIPPLQQHTQELSADIVPACLPHLCPIPQPPPEQAFGKKKLRWKRIAEHFDRKAKACKRHYHKVSGKEAPEDDD